MANSEYTDFYHFNWDVVIGHRAGKKSRLIKVGILVVILGILTILLRALNNYLQLSSYEFFWFMFFFAVLFVGVIGVFWEQFSNEVGSVSLQKYKISRDGLEVNSKLTTFSSFDKEKVSLVIADLNQQLKETIDTYYLDIPLQKVNLKVHFSSQKEAERFVKALRYYLKI